ncbi:MAG: hypothetical protein K5917_00520 [Clostridiales bacterium]|nr:hypothetical protein [Clostridiales bacterium]
MKGIIINVAVIVIAIIFIALMIRSKIREVRGKGCSGCSQSDCCANCNKADQKTK